MFSSQTYKYKSTTVGKYLLAKAIEERIVMNMTKLQKLLYIVYGVYLTIADKRLTNESPKAWPYGPVFPTVRKNLLNIDFYDYDFSTEKDAECKTISNDEELKDIMRIVLNKFGLWDSDQLVNWTHIINSPWDRTQNSPGFKWNDIIPDAYTEEYFSKIVKLKNDA